jgi:hypothetical protein
MSLANSIEEIVEQLKRDPSQPVRTRVAGLTIEVRAVDEPAASGSAAELFAELGPWDGESTEEMLSLLAFARRQGARRSVQDL